MKIKVVNFNTLLGNPIENEKQIESEFLLNESQVLIFPGMVFTGSSCKDTIYNETIEMAQEKALEKLSEFLIKHPQNNTIAFSSIFDYNKGKEVPFFIHGNSIYTSEIPEIMVGKNKLIPMIILGNDFPTHIPYNVNCIIHLNNTLNYLGLEEKIQKKIEVISEINHCLYIYNSNRGEESTSQGSFLSYKSIVADGETLMHWNISSAEWNYDLSEINKIRIKNHLSVASNLNPSEISLTEPSFDYDYPLNPIPYFNFSKRNTYFEEILEMQGQGLYKKMKSMNRWKICLGISGGLDSTVSLLSCVNIFKKLHLPLENIIGITMPGLGTTERTYKNSLSLMKALGITVWDIDLKPLLNLHLKNIKQPKGKFDITFEQTQSRERTQVLLDFANKENAIMIGTGCMSEFALGWMTYGGDHLSMYAINIGLPKTLVKEFAKWYYEKENEKIKSVLLDIIHSPVSPELLPLDEKGQQHEKTENIIGDYIVQDLFIYYIIKKDYSLTKIFNLACKIFPEYSKDEIFRCLKIFATRFITRQYKKNCYGDGIQILDYSVSPFTGYKSPSDMNFTVWEKELNEIEKGISK